MVGSGSRICVGWVVLTIALPSSHPHTMESGVPQSPGRGVVGNSLLVAKLRLYDPGCSAKSVADGLRGTKIALCACWGLLLCKTISMLVEIL